MIIVEHQRVNLIVAAIRACLQYASCTSDLLLILSPMKLVYEGTSSSQRESCNDSNFIGCFGPSYKFSSFSQLNSIGTGRHICVSRFPIVFVFWSLPGLHSTGSFSRQNFRYQGIRLHPSRHFSTMTPWLVEMRLRTVCHLICCRGAMRPNHQLSATIHFRLPPVSTSHTK